MTADELLPRVKDLPFPSTGALRLVALLDQAHASNESVVEILRCDSVLTARLLRLCNSSYFGFSGGISSVNQAVLMLGHQQIMRLVLTLEFSGTLRVPLPGYAVEAKEFWNHSLAAATAAEVFVHQGMPDAEPAMAFTVGLLHDIGKLVLSCVLTPGAQIEIRQRIAAARIPRNLAEKEILGTDHAEVGAALLQTWNLPPEIVEAVAHHHHPVLQPRPGLSALAHVADLAAHLAGASPGWDSYAISVDDGVAASLNLTPEKLESLLLDIRENFERAQQLMNAA